jgi:hypothetical protein
MMCDVPGEWLRRCRASGMTDTQALTMWEHAALQEQVRVRIEALAAAMLIDEAREAGHGRGR